MFAVSKLATPLRATIRTGRMFISNTAVLMDKFNILVPPMGESIKSGKTCSLSCNA